METTCIMCPLGCNLIIKEKNGAIEVSGYTCKKGDAYGKEEYTNPKRMVTALVKTKSGKYKSVKTKNPIDKNKIFELLALINDTVVDDLLDIGDIAIKDALNLCDIVITRR